ncbi:hypothetical protein A2Z22_01940 [Candidatus Woesebacteria bacterium RBG_16_34_12]|uniref:TIR domain-containing protein n=1 Tax=Candidatus Woesebacteria bacterium RBG_16_34_12 TaxID=1802480 RepID=A0A1F7XAI9_9BACT|nr:MAG: hypothetical protein A2Z22_01940 [Candidatus Woesebacteria bacterium RBG_16_34_12]
MTEQLEKLKKDITEIQGIMVKVSTGRGNIDDFEDEYRILYFSIKEQLKTFRENGIYLPDLNFFSSLWDFYSHWKAGLKTYQERREYIRSLYKPIDDPITQVLTTSSSRTINPNELVKLLSSYSYKNIEDTESEVAPSMKKSKLTEQSTFEYDIALSFAGEHRNIAESIAHELKKLGISLFYDNFEQSKLWGKRLSKHFQEIYGQKTRFVVVLISKEYPIKDWTDFEFTIAREEAKNRKSEFILPIRIDDTLIFGLPSDVAYLDFNKVGVEGVVKNILIKLERFNLSS